MLLGDWELWACAQQVMKQHGVRAPLHAATRIGELAVRNDIAGVETWREIAARIDQLVDYRDGHPLTRQ